MAKKRKLNSKNPRWNKEDKNKKKYRKVLMKETNKFKIYFNYEIQ
tara:strand:+ start:886 stop:1020 length:135 start_codon:yes stop_codon:yes gene_type:complete